MINHSKYLFSSDALCLCFLLRLLRMEFQNLTMTTLRHQLRRRLQPQQRLSRDLYHVVKAFYLLVLLCSFFRVAAPGPCPLNGMLNSVVYDACGSLRDDYDAGVQNSYDGDIKLDYVVDNSSTCTNMENICKDTRSFCFPSTLTGFSSREHRIEAGVSGFSNRWSYDILEGPFDTSTEPGSSSRTLGQGRYKLYSGRSVYCSLSSKDGNRAFSSSISSGGDQKDVSSCGGHLLNPKSSDFGLKNNHETAELGFSDGTLSPHVQISPPLLDWGQKYLYFPSIVFLTVKNTHKDSVLRVYEPFSSNIQFYPCNFSEVLLGPGEVVSMCFVFLPRWLGLSSAQLILQTSAGGFLIQAKGYGVESPYGIHPLVGLNDSSIGRWSKNLSLFNPFDETLHIEEVTALISISSGNSFHSTEVLCSIENFDGYDDSSLLNFKSEPVVDTGEVGFPLLVVRPRGSWEINPLQSGSIAEIYVSSDIEGKLSGSVCVRVDSQNRNDIVMIPLEADVDRKAASYDLTGSVAASLEALMACDTGEKVVLALSLSNGTPYPLTLVKINEVTEPPGFLQIKFMGGLILFPGTITQVAVISYSSLTAKMLDLPHEVHNAHMNCKIHIKTNDSSDSQIEIPCQDILRICSKDKLDTYVRHTHHSRKVEFGNRITGSMDQNLQSKSQIKVSVMETADADDLILGNWKSQGTSSHLSVLDEHEVIFPLVQVGTRYSKLITVKNPSEQPVLMQLILNSGVIIDECRTSDELGQPPSSMLDSNESSSPTHYGFSLAEDSRTVAYVHPHSIASFGPIFFHPADRCQWRSSALIRNNLSGVEWLLLSGVGGSHSLVFFEDSKQVHSLDFDIELPRSFNISPSEVFNHMEDTMSACSQPLLKELHAKNVGDMPLEVTRIGVSGTECGLDGFKVDTCNSFALEPGESSEIRISYRTDFSAAMVHRDLELALSTGTLVMPMKATLPVDMVNLCKKSVFRMRVKRSIAAGLFAAPFMLLAFCRIVPQVMALVSMVSPFKSQSTSIASVRTAGKSSRMHHNKRNCNVAVSTKIDGLSSVERDETLILGATGQYPESQVGGSKEGIASHDLQPTAGNQKQTTGLPDGTKKCIQSSLSLSKSPAVESSDLLAASQPANLTVRIGKEKGRRRRRRRGTGAGAGAGFTALFEVSSSQSGNSTPSSPLSPVSAVTPKRVWPVSPDTEQSVEARSPFVQVTQRHYDKSKVLESATKADMMGHAFPVKYCSTSGASTLQQPSMPRKTVGHPILLPCATFPSTARPASSVLCSSPFLASTSTIAPASRAPGSRLYNHKTFQAEEKAVTGNQFTYDIWGDHFSGSNLLGRSKEVNHMNSSHTESGSNSFFVRGPQDLKSHPKAVSCFQEEG
ncbi:Transmembrane protein 131-like, N-terminal [Dillenia turbinata]|uniref:Transmembrane protein 131-like, N-terminal n=1 Tax=Dillenia turbinata TaxID=194707 RepID=A0AAN8UY76_9MAGN